MSGPPPISPLFPSAPLSLPTFSPGGVLHPLIPPICCRNLPRHCEHPQIRVALLSPSQPIAFGVEPYFSTVGRFDDASRMNGAEMLPGWRLNPGSHKDIGTVASVHRPTNFPAERISRNCAITTPNQFTLPGFSRHYYLHIRLVLAPRFKQGCEQASFNVPFYHIHDHCLSFHACACLLCEIAIPN